MSDNKLNFVNPYNFIPLRKREKEVLPEDEKNLSGVIKYSVLTKTPLFIANTSTDKAFSDSHVFGVNDEKIDVAEDDEKKAEKIAEIKKEHKRYDFFSYTKLEEGSDICSAPVIPGSEIRGMFRNQYEILTNSCLSNLDEKVVLSKRTAHNYEAGLIKKVGDGNYELYKAEDCLWRTKGEDSIEDEEHWDGKDYKNYTSRKCYRQKDFKEGQKVSFVSVSRGYKVKSLAKKVSSNISANVEIGYILKGEDGPVMPDKPGIVVAQKHCCHIFKVTKERISKSLDIDCLDKVLNEYKNNSGEGKVLYKEYTREWNEFKSNGDVGEFFPVYYSEVKYSNDDDSILLSPACKTREVYKSKITDFIDSKNLISCKSKKNICPACSLYGMISGNDAVASRIRFSDLTINRKLDDYSECYDPVVSLFPLSSPKIGNTEFYVKKPAPDAIFWTFDYYVDKNHKLHRIEKPELNGRKFYWHNMSIKKLSNDAKVSKLNMTIRPVKSGVTFSGKLFFDKISENELMKLVWMLNAGEVGDIDIKKHGYKLGAAKPLGLGSIAVSVDNVSVRNISSDVIEFNVVDATEKYAKTCVDAVFDKEVVEDFKIMTGFESVPTELKISYPIVPGQKEGDEGFTWFSNNHVAVKFDKKNNKNVDDKSPNKRNNQAFAFYMEPLQPELSHTDNMYMRFYEERVTGKKDLTSVPNTAPNTVPNKKFNYKINDVLEGQVIGINKTGKFAKVKLSNGGNASFYNLDNKGQSKKKKGDKVKLKYCGKDKNNNDRWEVV